MKRADEAYTNIFSGYPFFVEIKARFRQWMSEAYRVDITGENFAIAAATTIYFAERIPAEFARGPHYFRFPNRRLNRFAIAVRNKPARTADLSADARKLLFAL